MLTAAERDQTIVEHYPLVRTIARRMAQRFPSHVEVDELVNTGMLGLIDAVDRYDPARGVPFRSYAEIRIRGAIIDALRTSDWVPRAVRRRFSRLDAARVTLRNRLGRDPDREEMARELQVTVEEYDDLCEGALIQRVVALDAPTDDESGSRLVDQVPGDTTSTLDLWIDAEVSAGVAAAIEMLPEKERIVVTLYYQQGLALKEIGATLGVTEARACQLRGQGIKRLQHRLLRRDADT